jgi:hypothetical protein
MMDDVRLKGGKTGVLTNNPYARILAGAGAGGILEEWVNPVTMFSNRNPFLSMIQGKGNLAGSYEPQGGSEETLNRSMATLGALYGGWAGGAALGAGGAATETGAGGAATGAEGGAAAGAGVGGASGAGAAGTTAGTAAGMEGMAGAGGSATGMMGVAGAEAGVEGSTAGAGGMGSTVGNVGGMETGAVGGQASPGIEMGMGETSSSSSSAQSWITARHISKALRLINSINRMRQQRY